MRRIHQDNLSLHPSIKHFSQKHFEKNTCWKNGKYFLKRKFYRQPNTSGEEQGKSWNPRWWAAPSWISAFEVQSSFAFLYQNKVPIFDGNFETRAKIGKRAY